MLKFEGRDRGDLVRSLESELCPACRGVKNAKQSLCPDCWGLLPRPVARALYKPIGRGYEAALARAFAELGVKAPVWPEPVPPKGAPPPARGPGV